MPTFVTSSQFANSGQSGSLSVPAPASIVAGNLLLAFIGNDGINADPASTGWTFVGRASNSTSVAVLYKTATGAEPGSYTFTVTSSWLAGVICQYAGADPTGLSVTSNNTGGPNMVAPSVTPGASSMLWLTGYTNSAPQNLSSGPAGHTQRGAAFNGSGGAVWVYENTSSSGVATGTATAIPVASGGNACGISSLLASSGPGTINGTVTVALGPLTLTATGTTFATINGTATLTLGPLTLVATGVGLAGSQIRLGPLTLTATSTVSGIAGTPTIVGLADTPVTALPVSDTPLTTVTVQDMP